MNDLAHSIKERALTALAGEWTVIRVNGTVLLGNIGTWVFSLDTWTKVAALLLTIASLVYTAIRGMIEWQKLKRWMDDDPDNDPQE